MGGDVVDRDQRQFVDHGQPLGEGQPDEQGADQPRAQRHGQHLDLVELDAGLAQRLAAQAVDRLVVGAGGDLGNDAAVRGMQVDLRLDRLGQDDVALPPLDDGHGRLVAGGFDAQDVQAPAYLMSISLEICAQAWVRNAS